MGTLQQFASELMEALKARGLMERIKAMPEAEQEELAQAMVERICVLLGAEGE